MRQTALIASLLTALTLGSQGTWATDKDDPKARLDEINKSISEQERRKQTLEREAIEAQAEAEKLSASLVAAAHDIRMTEEEAGRIEQRIADLEAAATERQAVLDTRRAELVTLLGALERLSKRPVAFTLLQPQEALTTARSASLMSTLVPSINAQAEKLRTELDALSAIQDKLSGERYSLKNTLEQLTVRQQKLASLMDERKAQALRASVEAQQAARDIARFAEEAASLKELIEKLERQAAKRRTIAPVDVSPSRRSTPKPTDLSFARAKGTLPYPAVGRIVQGYGDKEAVGVSRGIRIRARAGAQVISPYDGQILFSGPFRDYGRLLIIDHGDGYYSLLAGLEDVQGIVGQWILKGEPVGTLAKAGANSELYMELRHKGTPMDPAPWLSRQTAQAR